LLRVGVSMDLSLLTVSRRFRWTERVTVGVKAAIARQKQIILEIEERGHDASASRQFLKTLQLCHKKSKSDLARAREKIRQFQ
jgi:hypothetical protein